MNETASPDRDLKSLPNVHDPFPLYAWLRDHDPLHWSESLNAWVVTRYADVLEVFNQPSTFSSDRFRKIDERYASSRPGRAGGRRGARPIGSCFATRPTTTACAGSCRRRSRRRSSARAATASRRRSTRCSTASSARGEMDFIRELAFPLPGDGDRGPAWARRPADIEPIKTWSDRLAAYLGGAVDERDNFDEASAGVAALVDYFRDAAARARAPPARRPDEPHARAPSTRAIA